MLFLIRLRRNKRKKERGSQTNNTNDYEFSSELSPGSIPRNHFTLEQNNEFIYGVSAGIIGAIVKYGFNELMQVLNIAMFDNNATSLTVVMKSFDYTLPYWIFGFIMALIIGAFFGLVIAFLFTYIFSEEFFFIKSIGIGIVIWLFNFGFAAKVFNYPEAIKHSLGDMVSMLLSFIIYAVVVSYSLKIMGFFKQDNK